MKAKEVLKELNITRPTLTKYVKQGLIKVDSEINGQYNYNKESVMNLLKGVETAEISTESTPVKFSTVTEDKVNEVINVLLDICTVLDQLSAMRLLTPQSISKIQSAKDTLNNLKEK